MNPWNSHLRTPLLAARPLVVVALSLALFAACGGWETPCGAAAPPPARRFPMLSQDDAWQRLPWQGPPLPAWARALAAALPRTTVAMLTLDHVHRARNPLGTVLAGKLRWTAADA